MPKYYSDVCEGEINGGACSVTGYQIEYGDPANYRILKNETGLDAEIGRGHYSIVYKGVDLRNDQPIIIKALEPVRVSKFHKEIKIL